MKKSRHLKPKKTEKNFIIIYLAVIIIITGTAFYPSIQNGFTNWDDDKYVTNNILIMTLSWKNLKNIFTSGHMGIYHPLTLLSYSIEYYFFKLNPHIYHITNLLLHILNTILVFYFIYILSNKPSLSFTGGILFGIHPLHVESVGWISERKDVLSTFFFLIAFIFYLYYKKTQKNKYYYLTICIYLLSVLSKPMTITFPFLLFLTDYLRERNINKKNIIEKIPFFIITVIFGITGFFAQKNAGSIQNFSFFDNLFIAFYGFIFYLVKIIVPVNLSCIYPYPQKINNILPLFFYISPLLVIITGIIIYRSTTYTRKIFFGFTFFFITLLPVIKFIPIGNAIAADRYAYIPSIGIFYLIGEAISYLYNKPAIKKFIIPVGIIIVITLSFLTWERCLIWENSITLWSDVCKKYPHVIEAYNNRGNAYGQNGEFEKALLDFNKAIKIDSINPDAYNNRGNTYNQLGEYEIAIDNYNKVIELDPNNFEAYNNRGSAYNKKREYDKAIKDFTKALSLSPDFAESYNNRGNAYSQKKEYDRAIKDYDKALEINPDYGKAWNNRGIAYGTIGQYDRAINDFNMAIKINPSDGEAYYNRCFTYIMIKDYEKAWQDIKKMEETGYPVDPEFIENLRRKSGKTIDK